jgi:hypothetical protein
VKIRLTPFGEKHDALTFVGPGRGVRI